MRMMKKGIWKAFDEAKPALLMVIVQIGYASTNVLYKIAINHGMSVLVLIAYRLIFASALTVPLALILERNKRPKLTWRVLYMSFLCGLFGLTIFQNLILESLALISATFSSAVCNLIPGATFVLAVCCGLERMNLGKAAGKAKVLGTITGIGGAMILTFVKGIEINIWSSHIHLLHQNAAVSSSTHGGSKLVLGVVCGIASCLCFAIWLIIQAKLNKDYPTPYSSTALMTTMGAIQSTVFALCVEKDWSQWRLHWNIRLLTVAYSGMVGSGIMGVMIVWCIRMRGPLFASIFMPLFLVLMAILGSLMLEENLYLGSVIGAVLIVVGLYMVLWGKSKEMKTMREIVPSDQNNEQESEVITDVVIVVDQNNHNQIITRSRSIIDDDISEIDCDGDSSKTQHNEEPSPQNKKTEDDLPTSV